MSVIHQSTPLDDGYWMPGEFEAHDRTWMLWPQRPDNWRDDGEPAQRAFTEVARAISQFEPVVMGVNGDQMGNARGMLPKQVRLVEIPNNDAWMRDCGPTFVINSERNVRGINWKFNAWGGLDGGLYSPWDLDDRVPESVFALEGLDGYEAPIVLEGGSIHVDGEGTVLTTEECLLNPNRNPGLSRTDLERALMSYLNVNRIIWLERGVFLDETSGHVDNLCCFLRPGEVALTWTDDPADPQFEISRDAYRRLELVTDAQGRKLSINRLLQPEPMTITQQEAEGVSMAEGTKPRRAGDRMPASYVNFYFCNHGLILPTFGDPHDQMAIDTLQSLLPERKIVGIAAREILLGGGNIHCITQQQPKRKGD